MPHEHLPEHESKMANHSSLVRVWKRVCAAETFFLIVALPYGILFALLTPPNQAPDESAHLCRSFQVSDGRIIAIKRGHETGDELPSSIITFHRVFAHIPGKLEEKTSMSAIVRAGEIPITSADRAFQRFSNTAIHSPIPYLPQALGILLARQLSPSLLVAYYAGRIFNLIAYVGLVFHSIRRTPIGKWIFVTMALTPMSLFLAGSLSSDAMTNGTAYVLVSEAMFCCFAPIDKFVGKKVPWSNVLSMAAIGGGMGLCKQAYFLLPLCYLLIPSQRMETPSRYWKGFLVVMGTTFLGVAGWGLVVRGIYSPVVLEYNIDPFNRMILILTGPLEFLILVAQTLCAMGFVIFAGYLGILGSLDVPLPLWILLLQAAVLFLAVLVSSDTYPEFNFRQLLVGSGIASVSTLTVFAVIRMTWDIDEAKIIFVQGRYFIPIGPLIGICGINQKLARLFCFPQKPVYVIRTMQLAIVCLLAGSIVSLIYRYFVDTPDTAAIRAFQRANSVLAGGDIPQDANTLPTGVLSPSVRIEYALKNMKTATELKPEFYGFRQKFGEILMNQGRFDEASEQFRTALAIKPDFGRAHFNLGLVLAELGQNDESEQEIRTAIRLDPSLVQAQQDMMRVQSRKRTQE